MQRYEIGTKTNFYNKYSKMNVMIPIINAPKLRGG